MQKTSMCLIVLGVIAWIAPEIRAHGFVAPPGVGQGLSGGGNPNGSTGANPASNTGQPATFTPGASTGTPGGATGGKLGGGARPPGFPGRATNRGASGIGTDGVADDAATAIALGAAFKTALAADVGKLKDRTVTLDVSCLDSALRKVEFRIKLSELRGASASRRIDVLEKSGDGFATKEIYFVRDARGLTTVERWSREGGVRKLSSMLSDIKLGATNIQLADIVPFDPTGYTYTFKRAAEVDFVPHETYTAKSGIDNGLSATVTFRSDLRAPTHVEWTRGGVRTRGYDFSGWRFTSGVVTPGRITVLGASLEPVATLDVREAQVNSGLKADHFDASKLAGAEVVSGAR